MNNDSGEGGVAEVRIEELTLAQYSGALDLMCRTPGIAVRATDSVEATRRFLERNPGLSFVAMAHGRVVGCAMCGHDGRRGYLQHVVVDPAYRRRGLARALVDRCLEGLRALGIDKAHLEVLVENAEAHRYWTGAGWTRREDIVRYSRMLG